MDGIDTEKIPLLNGVDNPGADETGEQMEMRNLNPYDSFGVVRLILQVFTKHMKKLHSVETQVILRHYLGEKKVLTPLGQELRVNFQTIIRLIHHSLLA